MSAHRRGRHRLGTPGLRHCRELPAVRDRLERIPHRHSAAESRRLRPAHVVGAAVATASAVVGGWLATGSTALADIIGAR